METEKTKSYENGTVIKLDYPVEFAGQEYTEITMYKPKGKHLKVLPAEPKPSDMLKLASKVSRVSVGVFEEMYGEDISKVMDFLGDNL